MFLALEGPVPSPAGVPVFRWLKDEVKVMYEYPQGFPLQASYFGPLNL